MIIILYSNNSFGSFGNFGRYGFDNKWDKLQRDIAERMEDPFMVRESLKNIKETWDRYCKFRDEFDRDSTALMDIKSDWKNRSISLNTSHTVYGNDAKAVILMMRSGKITAREDWVDFAIQAKNVISLGRSILSAKSFDELIENLSNDLVSITTILDEAIDQLIRDNARLIQRVLFEEENVANKAETYLREYGGFTFRYNAGRLGFSIDIFAPPFAISKSIPVPTYDRTPSYNQSSPDNTIIPPYTSSPYTIYTVKSGDSFWKIAAEQMGSGAKYEELARYNGLTSSSVIHPGDVLKIPR